MEQETFSLIWCLLGIITTVFVVSNSYIIMQTYQKTLSAREENQNDQHNIL